MHQEHLPALLDPLLQQRTPLILGYVHVVQQRQELLVDLFVGQPVDLVRGGFAAVPGRNGATHDIVVVVATAAVAFRGRLFWAAKKRIQQAGLAFLIVSRHSST